MNSALEEICHVAREEAGDSQLVSGRSHHHASSEWLSRPHKTARNLCWQKIAASATLRSRSPNVFTVILTDWCSSSLEKILRIKTYWSQRGGPDGTTVHLVVRSRGKGILPSPSTLLSPAGPCAHRSVIHPPQRVLGCQLGLGQLARTSPELADFFGQLAQLLMVVPEPTGPSLEDPVVWAGSGK